jgi:competence protein ComEC
MLLHALAFLVGNLLVHGLFHSLGSYLGLAFAFLPLYACPRWRCFASLALGVGITSLSVANALEQRLAVADDGVAQRLEVRVVDFPRQQHWGGQSVTVSLVSTPSALAQGKLNLVFPPWLATPRPGQRWQVDAKLRVPRGFASPHASDRERYFAAAGLHATGQVEDGVLLSHRASFLGAWRHALARRLEEAVPQSQAAWLSALLLGDRTGLDPDRQQALQRTGTAHLIAISGMHVAMVATLGFVVAGLFLRCFPHQLKSTARRQWGAVSGCLLAVVYAALAGFSLPTVRAMLMLSVALVLLLMRWRWSTAEALALALFAVLLVDPLASLSVGFWLSFAAVALLLFLAWQPVQPGFWRGLWHTQWRLPLLMVPLTLVFFGFASLVAPLANLLAVPIVMLVVLPMALLGLLGSVIFEVDWLLQGAGWSMAWLVEGLYSLAQWSWLAWQPVQRPLLLQFALLMGLGLLLLPFSGRLRLGAVLCFLPWLLYQPQRPAAGQWQAQIFDVGHGQAVAVSTQQHLLLYDLGPAWAGGSDAFTAVVEPSLKAAGWREIEYLVLSSQTGHHAGGWASVVNGWVVRHSLVAPPARDHATACAAGMRWRLDGVDFELLHPASSLPALAGDTSCVLLVEGESASLLLLGDISRAVEPRVLRALAGRPVDAILAARHGSASANTPSFISTLSPQWLLVSGEQPSWTAAELPPWRPTGSMGSLTLESLPTGGAVLHGWRQQAPAWWRSPPSRANSERQHW